MGHSDRPAPHRGDGRPHRAFQFTAFGGLLECRTPLPNDSRAVHLGEQRVVRGEQDIGDLPWKLFQQIAELNVSGILWNPNLRLIAQGSMATSRSPQGSCAVDVICAD